MWLWLYNERRNRGGFHACMCVWVNIHNRLSIYVYEWECMIYQIDVNLMSYTYDMSNDIRFEFILALCRFQAYSYKMYNDCICLELFSLYYWDENRKAKQHYAYRLANYTVGFAYNQHNKTHAISVKNSGFSSLYLDLFARIFYLTISINNFFFYRKTKYKKAHVAITIIDNVVIEDICAKNI